jgi:DNA-binding response OmpR family regulator
LLGSLRERDGLRGDGESVNMIRKRVVIIDDDRELLDELKEALSGDVYEVVTLQDPQAAIESVRSMKPHLIVVDLKMPKKTGFQLASELRGFSEVAGVPIVGMTGVFIEAEHHLLMNMCGIRHCLKKPFSPQEAMAEIERIFLQESLHEGSH